MTPFNAIADPPVLCPICKSNMLITTLKIENNLDALMYGFPPHVPLSRGQEITLELSCQKCGSKGIGKAEEVHASASDIQVKNIHIQEIKLEESVLLSEEDTFDPSYR
jgi:hypothetical protein